MLNKVIKLLNKLTEKSFTGKIVVRIKNGEVKGVEQQKEDESVEYREG